MKYISLNQLLVCAAMLAMQPASSQVNTAPLGKSEIQSNLAEASKQLAVLVERLKREGKDPAAHPDVLAFLKTMRAQYGHQVTEELAKLTLNAPAKLPDTELAKAMQNAREEQSGIARFIDLAAKKNQEISFTPIPSGGKVPSSLGRSGVRANGEALSTAQQKNPAHPLGQLYIFASFGLPEKVLDKLIAHAITWRGVVVLRGFIENDAKKSQQVAARYIGMPNFQLNIDPFMFKRFDVNSVPAFLMELPGEVDKVKCYSDGDCQPENFYLSVEGDVNPTFAFDKMREHSAIASRKLDAYIKQFAK